MGPVVLHLIRALAFLLVFLEQRLVVRRRTDQTEILANLVPVQEEIDGRSGFAVSELGYDVEIRQDEIVQLTIRNFLFPVLLAKFIEWDCQQ